jgi:hypothetical protein
MMGFEALTSRALPVALQHGWEIDLVSQIENISNWQTLSIPDIWSKSIASTPSL